MSNASLSVWAHAAAAPDRVALRGAGDGGWTYGQVRERAAAVRELLNVHGVRPGDRVLLVAPSVPEFAMAYYGILAAGAIAVTANTMATERELTYMAREADARLV